MGDDSTERRARELLAAEYKAAGLGGHYLCLTRGVKTDEVEDAALRAIEKALALSPPVHSVPE